MLITTFDDTNSFSRNKKKKSKIKKGIYRNSSLLCCLSLSLLPVRSGGFNVTPVYAPYWTGIEFVGLLLKTRFPVGTEKICAFMNAKTALWCQTLHIHHSTQWNSNTQQSELEEKHIGFFFFLTGGALEVPFGYDSYKSDKNRRRLQTNAKKKKKSKQSD